MERKHGCAGCLTILAVVAVIGLLSRSSDKPKSNPAQTPATFSAPTDSSEQHETHLDELKAERQSKYQFWMISLGAEARIRRDLMIVRDPELRKLDPFPNPNQEQELLTELDKMVKDNAESKAEIDALDAEIAKEEASVVPSIPGAKDLPLEPSATTPQPLSATSPLAPPAEASKPTSGVLCNWPVEVPQNGEVKFRNLPSDRLKFTFDHDAWLPRIQREPDGTQTLIMQSIKPGIQTMCDIRWEVVR
jgi:hypothetical protein